MDECLKELDNCDKDATCTNNKGSFKCTCNTGYEGTGEQCKGHFYLSLFCEHQCGGEIFLFFLPLLSHSYSKHFFQHENHTNSHLLVLKTDQKVAIKRGAEHREDIETDHLIDHLLSDIDECVRGTDNCNEDASCTNTVGSFSCMCNYGYSGNGVNCSGLLHFSLLC